MKTGASGKFFVTPHAIDQYLLRVRPGVSRQEALADLIRTSLGATKVRDFPDGRELWRGPNKGVVRRLLFIVAPSREGVLPVIETVPPRRQSPPQPNNHRARKRAKRAAAYHAGEVVRRAGEHL